jgi:hypothetical protein
LVKITGKERLLLGSGLKIEPVAAVNFQAETLRIRNMLASLKPVLRIRILDPMLLGSGINFFSDPCYDPFF